MITHYNVLNFREDIKRLVEIIDKRYDYIYGVPRGGIPLAVALSQEFGIPLADDLGGGFHFLVVDDVIDSGRTREKYKDYDFACLHIKSEASINTTSNTFSVHGEVKDWIEYFWEGEEQPAEDAVVRLIQAIGDDPNREGMLDTPKRVVKSWQQLFCGYEGDSEERVKNMFTQFASDGYDELVLLKDIEFFSFCEHHMLPFFGKAHIAYIPKEKVVGISKLARLLDIHSRKFQIQERIGELVTKDIMKHLGAHGAACIIEAQHLCLSGDSLIELAYLDRSKYPKGIPIKDLVNKQGLSVYCYDKKKEEITIDEIVNIWKVGKKVVYEVAYEWYVFNQHKKIRKTNSIKITKDHLIMLGNKSCNRHNNKKIYRKGGSYLSIEKGLTVQDSLMPFDCYETNGYYALLFNNGEAVPEHRFLLEHKLKRKLEAGEVSHHNNENPSDNSFENLACKTTKKELGQLHMSRKKKPRKYAFTDHKIISIVKVGLEDVYDLETKKHHNFAVNDIIVHNCMKMRGVSKQHSVMTTSSMKGAFLEKPAARAELMALIK